MVVKRLDKSYNIYDQILVSGFNENKPEQHRGTSTHLHHHTPIHNPYIAHHQGRYRLTMNCLIWIKLLVHPVIRYTCMYVYITSYMHDVVQLQVNMNWSNNVMIFKIPFSSCRITLDMLGIVAACKFEMCMHMCIGCCNLLPCQKLFQIMLSSPHVHMVLPLQLRTQAAKYVINPISIEKVSLMIFLIDDETTKKNGVMLGVRDVGWWYTIELTNIEGMRQEISCDVMVCDKNIPLCRFLVIGEEMRSTIIRYKQ